MKKVHVLFVFCVFALSASVGADVDIESKLQNVLDEFIAENPSIPGVMVTLESDQLSLGWSGSAGISNFESKQAILPNPPLSLASTSKTYIAAAILRLMEQGKLDLDDSINQHLPKHLLASLKNGDYSPGIITIRHMLTHTSGLLDFGKLNAYAEAVISNPSHRWSREEQLKFAMGHGAPVGSPGERFHYSDTGYILLGEIIEQRSGMALAPALRKLLKFNELGLRSTWLETLEPVPETAPPRAHQYFGSTDVIDFDASMDLYGGGGLVANMPDLARFFEALFEGGVFEKPQSLATMLSSSIPDYGGPMSFETSHGFYQYCHGVYSSEYRNYTIFQHGGFWGTLGAYLPALDLSLGMAVTQQKTVEQRQKLLEALLEVVIELT